jgi:glycosyltransferase involved in cell wall biosynthesis
MSSLSPSRVPILLMVRELGIGGTERQLVETARFLPPERFAPQVGCFRPNGPRRADLESAGIPILHLPLYSLGSKALFPVASQFIRHLRRHQIQVVHSFDAPLNIFAVPIAKLAGTPAVISSQRGHRDLTGARNKRLLRITDRLADAVVVNCNAMRDYLIEEEGVSESKIRLCYNAVDFEHYRRVASSPRWPGHTVIGVVCALRPEKYLGTLIRAFARLSRKDVKLVIVGSGPEESGLKALVGEFGIGESCHFEPATSEVATWLNQIDIFVLPSRTEAFSNSLMEAMACSCCVLATRVGGNPELIDDGENGILFEVDNVDELARQLNAMLADPVHRKSLGAAAAAKVASRFSYSHAAATMQQIYDSVLQSARPKLRSLAKSSG